MPPRPFHIPFRDHVLRGDAYARDCSTIVLHGAGGSSRDRFLRLRRSLNQRGMPSVSFDFIGQGETVGSLLGSTLHDRTDQAAAVIGSECRAPLTIIGASMGAYTAVRLADHFPVENLVLLVPAAYTPLAYDLPFGPEFSAAIREPGSWHRSDAFEILGRFTGRLLIVAAELDAVIPRGLVERLFAAATKAATRQLHTVRGAQHTALFANTTEYRTALDLVVQMCGR